MEVVRSKKIKQVSESSSQSRQFLKSRNLTQKASDLQLSNIREPQGMRPTRSRAPILKEESPVKAATPRPPRREPPPPNTKENKENAASAEGGEYLEGLTIVVSGQFQAVTRADIESFITNHGGRQTSAISGKTSYLVIGYKLEDGREVTQGGKYRKAKEKGIPILDEEGFEKLVREKSGNAEFTLGTRKEILKEVENTAESMKPRRSSRMVDENGEAKPCTEMWTDIYKPNTINDLVGNQGVVNNLYEWLRDWEDVHVRGNTK